MIFSSRTLFILIKNVFFPSVHEMGHYICYCASLHSFSWSSVHSDQCCYLHQICRYSFGQSFRPGTQLCHIRRIITMFPQYIHTFGQTWYCHLWSSKVKYSSLRIKKKNNSVFHDFEFSRSFLFQIYCWNGILCSLWSFVNQNKSNIQNISFSISIS